jgi:hypothetical protein
MIEQRILDGLVARGIPAPAAIGIVSRMRAESNLNPAINEIAPIVPGSRGGYGLNQWTGPRRKQFEAFAASVGKPVDDLEAQLDFTVWELQNTEKAAGDAVLAAKTPEEAARLYMEKYLRPGIPHRDMSVGGKNALAQPPQYEPQQQNALAQAQRPMFQYNALQLTPYRMT